MNNSCHKQKIGLHKIQDVFKFCSYVGLFAATTGYPCSIYNASIHYTQYNTTKQYMLHELISDSARIVCYKLFAESWDKTV